MKKINKYDYCLVVVVSNLFFLTNVGYCAVPEDRLQVSVWGVGASDRSEGEGGYCDCACSCYAERGACEGVPGRHCHDGYWKNRLDDTWFI